jgi:hypothetical protein
MIMVTFLPVRLGPWAAAGMSARTLDASDPAMAIRLTFLLGIDVLSAARLVPFVFFYILLVRAMGAKVARR